MNVTLKPLASLALALTIFLAGALTGLNAQSFSDSPQRVEVKRAELSSPDHMDVIVSTAEYKPGETIDRHFHHGLEVAYVVQGADIQAPDKPVATLGTGTSLLNLRDVRHAGFKVVGTTSLKLFTVHIVDKGAPLYDYSH